MTFPVPVYKKPPALALASPEDISPLLQAGRQAFPGSRNSGCAPHRGIDVNPLNSGEGRPRQNISMPPIEEDSETPEIAPKWLFYVLILILAGVAILLTGASSGESTSSVEVVFAERSATRKSETIREETTLSSDNLPISYQLSSTLLRRQQEDTPGYLESSRKVTLTTQVNKTETSAAPSKPFRRRKEACLEHLGPSKKFKLTTHVDKTKTSAATRRPFRQSKKATSVHLGSLGKVPSTSHFDKMKSVASRRNVYSTYNVSSSTGAQRNMNGTKPDRPFSTKRHFR